VSDWPCKQDECPELCDYGSGYCSKHHDEWSERERDADRAKREADWDAAYKLGREHMHADMMNYARRIDDQNPYRKPACQPTKGVNE
jgi:hypothetical protein